MTPEEFQAQAIIKTLESAGIDAELDNSAFVFHGVKCAIKSFGGILYLWHLFRLADKPPRAHVLEFCNELNKHMPFGNLTFVNGCEISLRISLFAASPNTLRWSVRQALCMIYLMADILPQATKEIANGHQQAVDAFAGLLIEKEPDSPRWFDFIKTPDQYVISHMKEDDNRWFSNLTIPMYEMENGVDYIIADGWSALEEPDDDEDFEDDEEEQDYTSLPEEPPEIKVDTVTQRIIIDCGGQDGQQGDGSEDGELPASEGV